jgi:hypothetical protein
MPPAGFDPLQQPKGDDIPDVPIVVPLPNAPGVVADPTQDEEGLSAGNEELRVGDGERLSVGAGAGAGTIGLMPELLSSVAPSGMVPMPSVDPAVAPEADKLCVPDTVPPKGTEPQGPDTPTFPPPSKVEPDPAVPAIPVAVTDIPFVPQSEVLVVEPSGPGLSPPGSSSVEPKGMPTGPAEPVPPKGDVIPIPGEAPGPVGAICDMAGAPPSNSIAHAIGSKYLIDVSIICSSPRARFARASRHCGRH